MPNQIPIPIDPRVGRLAQAYSSFCKAIETDPDVKNKFKTVFTNLESNPPGTKPMRPGPYPAKSHMPFAGLRVTKGSPSYFSEGQHSVPLFVEVVCECVGGFRESLDLAETIVRAIFPSPINRPDRAEYVKKLFDPVEQVEWVDMEFPLAETASTHMNEATPSIIRVDLLFKLDVYLNTGE